MADLQSAVIDPSKIKVRWEEPYTSEAVNRGLTSVPRGVYRGFIPAPQTVPDKTFRLAIDPTGGGFFADSALLYVDRVNGFALAVRDAAEPDFDMSARFTDGGGTQIPPAGEIWRVWADVDYTTSVPTTGEYHVTLDGDPIPDDAILFGKITMPGGATSIIQTYFSYVEGTERTMPFPTKREAGAYVAGDQYLGFLSGEEAWQVPSYNQKKAMNAAPTAPTASNPFVTKADTLDKVFAEPTVEVKATMVGVTRFQLSGWYYVGKSSSLLSYAKYFHLLFNFSYGEYPLMGSDGGVLGIAGMLLSDGITPLNPATHADVNGFVQNPWIVLDFSQTGDTSFTGSARIKALKKSTYSSLATTPASAFPYNDTFKYTHAITQFARQVSGSPSSLTGASSQDHFDDLLAHVNDRIKTIHPVSGSPSSWILLWRSNNNSTDASVTKRTVSIYWRDGHLIMLTGAYMFDPTTVKAGNDVELDSHISLLSICTEEDPSLWRSGFVHAVKMEALPGDTWSLYVDADWTTYAIQGGSPYVMDRDVGTLYQWGMDSSGDVPIAMYYGNMGSLFSGISANGNGFCMVSGAWYDHDNGWWQGGSSLIPVIARIVANGKTITAIHKSSVINETWQETDWDVVITDGQVSSNINAFPTLDINGAGGTTAYPIHDQCRFSLAVENMSTITQSVGDYDSVTWHGRIPDIDLVPIDADITVINYGTPPSSNWTAYPSVYHADEFGCTLSGGSDSIAPGVVAKFVGKVQLHVDGL